MHGRHVNPDKLRDLIARRGWTIKTFREQADLRPTLVSYVLAGDRQFSLLTATKAAYALGCEVEDFTDPDSHGEQVSTLG